MSDNFISNVLNILRLLKASPELNGHSMLEYIEKWAGAPIQESATLRVSAYLQDQCDGAITLIRQSSLPEEAIAGLLQTVTSLRNALAIRNITSAPTQHLPQLDAAISSFAILEGVSNLTAPPADKSDLEKLIKEIEQVVGLFDDSSIDPLVQTTAKKHLHILLATLRNVDALGVDSAMAAYFELVIRLKRVDVSASETSRSRVAKVWPTLEKWGGRLAIIDKVLNSGQGLLDQAKGIGQALLNYFPGSS